MAELRTLIYQIVQHEQANSLAHPSSAVGNPWVVDDKLRSPHNDRLDVVPSAGG
jgi:hypothetical protein